MNTTKKETKKVYVIASTEYEANMPDLFLMDQEGIYYGVTHNSYACWHDYPKSIEHWFDAEGSDKGRYFNIDEVELPVEQIEKFDAITKEYEQLSDSMPTFEHEYPFPSQYKTKKAYWEACEEHVKKYKEWLEENNIPEYNMRKSALWTERTKLFCTFSSKVYEAIKDNDPIKHL